MHDYGVKPARN